MMTDSFVAMKRHGGKCNLEWQKRELLKKKAVNTAAGLPRHAAYAACR